MFNHRTYFFKKFSILELDFLIDLCSNFHAWGVGIEFTSYGRHFSVELSVGPLTSTFEVFWDGL